MRAALWMFGGNGRMAAAQSLARAGQKLFARDGMIEKLPGQLKGWTQARDFPALPQQSFRAWWKSREKTEK